MPAGGSGGRAVKVVRLPQRQDASSLLSAPSAGSGSVLTLPSRSLPSPCLVSAGVDGQPGAWQLLRQRGRL